MTHGATKKNNIHSSNTNSKERKLGRNKEKSGVSSTERPEFRISAAPSGLNFGDVLFGTRVTKKTSNSQEKTTGYGSRNRKSDDDSDSEREGKLLKPINSSSIELDLIDGYPGVPRVLDDSLDADPLDSFYYVNWDDPIYDQFDEFGQVLEDPEVVNSASEATDEETDSGELLKSSIHVTYNDHHPQRPRAQMDKGPKVEEIAVKCDPDKCRLPDCKCGGTESPGGLAPANTPQLVVLTFDDSINDLNKRLYKDIFHPSRKNPNGCPIPATFYVR